MYKIVWENKNLKEEYESIDALITRMRIILTDGINLGEQLKIVRCENGDCTSYNTNSDSDLHRI